MYAYIKGVLVEQPPLFAVVDVNGIGYQIAVPVSDYGHLPQIGGSICLYTAFIVRELSQTLYGFLDKQARDLFQELIAISGVGPKMGLAIIGHLSLRQLQEAIDAHDYTPLAKVPGIGKKTAERLLVEMRGRLKVHTSFHEDLPKPIGRLNDALQALIQLGYSQANAEKAVKKALDNLSSDCDLPTLISAALKAQIM